MNSDSENEQIVEESKVNKVPFKWTQEYEELLEELLMKHMFDFKKTSEELDKIINDPSKS